MSSLSCYICHRTGHIARECDVRKRQCYKCFKRGHNARRCPLLKLRTGFSGGSSSSNLRGIDMKAKQSSKTNVEKSVDENNVQVKQEIKEEIAENINENNRKGKQEIKKEIAENINESDSEDSESDDDTESDSSEKEERNGDFDHQWQELRNEAPDTNEITHRIAVCNMDWDRIRAIDLFVCFDSFKPASGCINSVKIYPSEFGLKRMEVERLKGPPELTEETLPADKEEEEEVEVEDKKGSKFHREKLRQYQISRLKYYYAVVDCDSPETANTLYEQLNGMEYESSAVRFDLRFIPNDMTFDHEPTSVVDKAPDPSEYKPRLFVTTALQQVKVDLTWDETDPKRKDFFQRIFILPESVENEIQDYLAPASSESDDEADAENEESLKKLSTREKITKYKKVLSELEEEERREKEERANKYNLAFTWTPATKEKTEEKVKEKLKKDSSTPFEELLHKKKEEKKLKKKEQKMQKQSEEFDDSEEESSRNIPEEKPENDMKLAELSLIAGCSKEETESEENTKKKKKKKAKSQDLDGFVGDLNDPRFSAMYTSSLFDTARSDQHPNKESNFGFKRSKGKKFKSKSYESQKSSKKARYH